MSDLRFDDALSSQLSSSTRFNWSDVTKYVTQIVVVAALYLCCTADANIPPAATISCLFSVGTVSCTKKHHGKIHYPEPINDQRSWPPEHVSMVFFNYLLIYVYVPLVVAVIIFDQFLLNLAHRLFSATASMSLLGKKNNNISKNNGLGPANVINLYRNKMTANQRVLLYF